MRSARSDTRTDRPRATVLGSFVEGWRRTLRAPGTIAGVALLTLAAALPLAIAVYTARMSQLGPGPLTHGLIPEWDFGWADELGAYARGVATSFTHEILGFGSTLSALGAVLDGTWPDPAVAIAAILYIGLWIFVSGGILDRFARGRATGPRAFVSACGGYFGRLLRIAAVTGLGYWAILAWLHPLLFSTIWDRWTSDLTSETTALWLRAGLYAALATALISVGIVADFAKVRTVVEDRRSMVGALISATRFVRRRPARVVALYLLNTGAAVVLAGLWMWVDPSASWTPSMAFAVAQLYIVGRLIAKLAFMASEIAFFQGELAHAPSSAAPDTVWPDSPAVESLR